MWNSICQGKQCEPPTTFQIIIVLTWIFWHPESYIADNTESRRLNLPLWPIAEGSGRMCRMLNITGDYTYITLKQHKHIAAKTSFQHSLDSFQCWHVGCTVQSHQSTKMESPSSQIPQLDSQFFVLLSLMSTSVHHCLHPPIHPPIHPSPSTQAEMASPVTFIMMEAVCCCWNASEPNHAGKHWNTK